MTAPTWTPAQAASEFSEAWEAYCKNPGGIDVRRFCCGWLSRHWPQPQPITGRALYEAYGDMAGIIYTWWDDLTPQVRTPWDRAAARLSPQPVSSFANRDNSANTGIGNPAAHGSNPQPVGVDVEAVAREIASTYFEQRAGSETTALTRIAADVLSRHLTAAPPPSAPVVVPVEVTAEDVWHAFDVVERGTSKFPSDSWKQARADIINACLAARAADVLPCRVVPVEFHDMQVVYDRLRQKPGYNLLDAVRDVNQRLRVRAAEIMQRQVHDEGNALIGTEMRQWFRDEDADVVPVEVTWEDIDAGLDAAGDAVKRGESSQWYAAFTEAVNPRLRARAADVVPCRKVPRPVSPQAGELVVPEDGVWVRRFQVQYGQGFTDPMTHNAGYVVSDTYDAIRRIDTDEPTTWIRRTTTTTPQPRPWEAGDCEAMVGRMVVFLWKCDGIDHGTVLHFATESADSIATMLERGGAHTAYILPAEVPHA